MIESEDGLDYSRQKFTEEKRTSQTLVRILLSLRYRRLNYRFLNVLQNELDTAIRLARAAGDEILRIFHDGFQIEEKWENPHYSEPVTIADKNSSQIIVKGLARTFPDDAILSEEEPDDTDRRMRKRRVWMIDPLDGTKGFTEKADDFAVQIALTEDGDPVLGVVFQPIKDLMYYAVKNEGAFITRRGEQQEKLGVSSIADFDKMTLAVSRSHRGKRMTRLVEHFGFGAEYPHGSVGLKVGFLARKVADIYIHLSPHTKFWDTAAPQIILEESGGRLTDIFGERIIYDIADVNNYNGVFSTNGVAHEQAVAHLRTLLTEFGRIRVVAGGRS